MKKRKDYFWLHCIVQVHHTNKMEVEIQKENMKEKKIVYVTSRFKTEDPTLGYQIKIYIFW